MPDRHSAVRGKLLVKAAAAAPALALVTYALFVAVHGDVIVLRAVQDGKQPIDDAALERLTRAAVRRFDEEKRYAVLEMLDTSQRHDLMISLLRTMVGARPNKAALRLQLADVLSETGRFRLAHEEYLRILDSFEQRVNR